MEECLGNQLVNQLVATGVSGSSPRFTQELLQDTIAWLFENDTSDAPTSSETPSLTF